MIAFECRYLCRYPPFGHLSDIPFSGEAEPGSVIFAFRYEQCVDSVVFLFDIESVNAISAVLAIDSLPVVPISQETIHHAFGSVAVDEVEMLSHFGIRLQRMGGAAIDQRRQKCQGEWQEFTEFHRI